QQDQNSTIIGHDGSGNNAINTAARIDIQSKDGIIILETGHPNMASTLADEWMFWKAGIADYVVMTRNQNYLLILLVSGYLLILILFILRFRKTRSK
ncbi:MAG: serine hydrolase, partial [Bacteroidota bacterium]